MSSITAAPGFARPVHVARPATRRPARAAGPVRLTRRGRVVVTLVFLALLLAAFTAFGSRTAATGEGGEPIATTTVVVHAGDTLWDIASQVAAPGETRAMVYRIQDLNGLDGAELSIGQRLVVPVPDGASR